MCVRVVFHAYCFAVLVLFSFLASVFGRFVPLFFCPLAPWRLASLFIVSFPLPPVKGSLLFTRTVSPDALPEIWVTKWVDYSSKYGVGYILSDGSVGVYFNDSTKIVLRSDGTRFDYITRRTQDKPEVQTVHTFDDFPEDLKKKVTLLRHFKNYMLPDTLEKKDGATVGESGLPAPGASAQPSDAVLFVKKWTRNKHAIMFQLNNKIVQVVFQDKTEAVLSSKSHMVTYVDKRGAVCPQLIGYENLLCFFFLCCFRDVGAAVFHCSCRDDVGRHRLPLFMVRVPWNRTDSVMC